jgi:two-component system, sensor histidine kinase and response regulator
MKDLTASRNTILAIDDEADVLRAIATTLTAAGYECHCAQDAQAARQAVASTAPDLIIADINLAGFSGIMLCEQLKADGELCDVPVMYLSAAQVPDIIRRSHLLGGAYYLRKPFDGPVLLQLIDRVLRVSHLSAV